MDYPKTLQACSDYITANQEILIETYSGDAARLSHASKVERIVEAYNILVPYADEIEGAILQILAGCAYQVFREGFHQRGIEAEPVFFAARDRLSSITE